MSRQQIPFAPDTLETVQRAFRLATDRRHDTVTLEHLLLALTQESGARSILTACGVDLPRLERQLEDVLLSGFTPVPGSVGVEPEPSLALDRVIQQAFAHA